MVPQLGTVENKPQLIHGLMCWGQNPAVGGPSSTWERAALRYLDWLVCVDLWETETAAFWKPTVPGDGTSDCLGIPGVHTEDIDTEVLLLPAAASYEKEGSITNSGRWSQWRYKALNPPGEAMDDLSILRELGKRLIDDYNTTTSGDSYLDDPVKNLYWGPYPGGTDAWGMDGTKYDDGVVDPRTGLLEANPHKVSKEINGYFCPSAGANAGKRVDGFWGNWNIAGLNTLREDGETSCGNWLYCSHYVNPGDPINPYEATNFDPLDLSSGNRQENMVPTDTSASGIGLYNNWTVCWPINRRIIYNGASVYQHGSTVGTPGAPLAPSKWVLDFTIGASNPANGADVTDGFTDPTGSQPRFPFIMLPEGHGKLFGSGREDGPFPEHYEPWETVMTSNIASQTIFAPTLFAHKRPERLERPTPANGPEEFPIIGTTYRLTEHWQAGQMTRNNPWLCELMPEPFVEIGEELAGLLSIGNGDWVEIKTQRSEIYQAYPDAANIPGFNNPGKRMVAKACVTKRFKPYWIGDPPAKHYHIGVIWHYGYTGCCTGASANLLTAHIGDANTGIPESKAFICNIRRADSPGDTGWLP